MSTNLQTKGDLVQQLANRLPLNELGLPDGIYRPDLLPDPTDANSNSNGNTNGNGGHDRSLASVESEQTKGELVPVGNTEISTRALTVAYPQLDYIDGYPSPANSGCPIWRRLDFEPPHAYDAFATYLEQGKDSTRSIELIIENTPHYDAADINEFSKLYYWRLRCRAFDIYEIAHRRHLRAKRIAQSDDDFYVQGTKMANIAEMYINSPEFFETLTPKVALETLRLAQQITQGALGNTPQQQKSRNGEPDEGISVDISAELRRVAGHNVAANKNTPAAAGSTDRYDGGSGILDELLINEDTAAAAQEVVLRVSVKGGGNKDGTI